MEVSILSVIGKTMPRASPSPMRERSEARTPIRERPVMNAMEAVHHRPLVDLSVRELPRLRSLATPLSADETRGLARANALSQHFGLGYAIEAGEAWAHHPDRIKIVVPKSEISLAEGADDRPLFGLILGEHAKLRYGGDAAEHAQDPAALHLLKSTITTLRVNNILAHAHADTPKFIAAHIEQRLGALAQKAKEENRSLSRSEQFAFALLAQAGNPKNVAFAGDPIVQRAIAEARPAVQSATRLASDLEIGFTELSPDEIKGEAQRSARIVTRELWPIFQKLFEADQQAEEKKQKPQENKGKTQTSTDPGGQPGDAGEDAAKTEEKGESESGSDGEGASSSDAGDRGLGELEKRLKAAAQSLDSKTKTAPARDKSNGTGETGQQEGKEQGSKAAAESGDHGDAETTKEQKGKDRPGDKQDGAPDSHEKSGGGSPIGVGGGGGGGNKGEGDGKSSSGEAGGKTSGTGGASSANATSGGGTSPASASNAGPNEKQGRANGGHQGWQAPGASGAGASGAGQNNSGPSASDDAKTNGSEKSDGGSPIGVGGAGGGGGGGNQGEGDGNGTSGQAGGKTSGSKGSSGETGVSETSQEGAGTQSGKRSSGTGTDGADQKNSGAGAVDKGGTEKGSGASQEDGAKNGTLEEAPGVAGADVTQPTAIRPKLDMRLSAIRKRQKPLLTALRRIFRDALDATDDLEHKHYALEGLEIDQSELVNSRINVHHTGQALPYFIVKEATKRSWNVVVMVDQSLSMLEDAGAGTANTKLDYAYELLVPLWDACDARDLGIANATGVFAAKDKTEIVKPLKKRARDEDKAKILDARHGDLETNPLAALHLAVKEALRGPGTRTIIIMLTDGQGAWTDEKTGEEIRDEGAVAAVAREIKAIEKKYPHIAIIGGCIGHEAQQIAQSYEHHFKAEDSSQMARELAPALAKAVKRLVER
jgi:hypothetical protein